MVKINFKIITAGLLLALLLSFVKCHHLKTENHKNSLFITDTISYFKNKLGTQTATIKVLEIEKETLEDEILKKNKDIAILASEFSKIKSITKYKTIIQSDTIKITYKDSVPFSFNRKGSFTHKWYQLNYTSNQNGIQIDSFSTWTETTILKGIKRKWLFGKETLMLDITNTNPNIHIESLQSIDMEIKTPWYKKWYFWFLAGFTGSVFIR